MLSQISIRAKITFAVAFLLVSIAGMGLLAILNMRAINASTVSLATGWMPSVRALGEMRYNTIALQSIIHRHVLASSASDKASLDQALAAGIDANNKIIGEYEKLISSPEERALYEEWNRARGEYKKLVLRVLDLSRKAGDRSSPEAETVYAGALSTISADADSILRKAIDVDNSGAAAETKHAADVYSAALLYMIALFAIVVTLGSGVAMYVIRNVSRGIASIIEPMQRLGNGDLDAIVHHKGEKNEIGRMADTLQVFKEALVAKRAADESAATEAEEKLERSRRVDSVTRDFEAMIGEIVETVSTASTQLEASAGTLSQTAQRSQSLATTVASASEEASTNVQSVASATEEMSSSVNEISRQVQDSARMATAAVDQARRTNDRVSELSKAAARIGDVVDLINTIAGQTNLLALNATIEAARAGEAGRGFAVVASEVKALAEQTAKATGEIAQQINGIQTATDESVGAIREISATIGRLSEISSAIAAAVEEQGAATQEISRNVQQAAHGTQQVTSSIADVKRGANETGSASSQVLAAAQLLSSDSSRLKDEVGKFLHAVRAA